MIANLDVMPLEVDGIQWTQAFHKTGKEFEVEVGFRKAHLILDLLDRILKK